MVFKLLSVVIITVIVSSLLKANAKEFLMPFQLITGFVLLIYILNESNGTLNEIRSLIDSYNGLSVSISSLMKAGIISVITKLSCDLCHESGNLFIEDVVEIGGRVMIFIITLPFITQIIEITAAFVK